MTPSATRPVPAAETLQHRRLEAELLSGEKLLLPVELQLADPRAAEACPTIEAQQWREWVALPLVRQGERLQVAIPSHWQAQQRQQLEEAVLANGITPDLRLGLEEEISEVLQQKMADRRHRPSEDTALASQPNGLSLLEGLSLESRLDEAPADQEQELDLEESLKASNASPVVSLVNRILIQAMESESSDIHVEPEEDGLRIRFRQDGVLHPVEHLPRSLAPTITSRFKIMAELDIAERRMPQDGRIRRVFRGRTIELRVSTLPGRWGEKVVLRLLDSGSTRLGLDRLITEPATLSTVRSMGSRPFGMVLVTGPTGSGKSTTLYSLLAERNEPSINISTVEDPIEYMLKGITQTQVNRDKGYDFSTALRAFMRQDPDVLLVGETRDGETAKTAIEAALTGHLVLTTLHCNDAPSAIARLSEMGVEPFMVSASLIGIVSQRLLRKVCGTCRVPYHPGEEELGHFGLFASQEQSITFYKARRGPRADGSSCPTCQGRGYKGRIGVYEVLRINDNLASAIAKGASTDVIRNLSIETGMKTLLVYGLELVRHGQTTLEEVERMLLTDTELESQRRAQALTTLTCQGCCAGLRDEWLECPYCLTPRR
jgi:type IV pilus assembly protein PilB